MKPWYLSKGVMGALVAIVSGLISLLLRATPDQQSAIQDTVTSTASWIVQGSAIAGSALALYGRITANTRLTLGGPTPPPPAMPVDPAIQKEH